jgi:hypothetical protein
VLACALQNLLAPLDGAGVLAPTAHHHVLLHK